MNFFKSFSVTKCHFGFFDYSDWRHNLEKFILPSIDGKTDTEQTSIAPINRPYANASNAADIFEDTSCGIIFFLLRREEKKISASMLKKRIADFEIRSGVKPGKAEKENIKNELMLTAPLKVDFVPVIVDTSGEVYIFSSSKKMVEEAKDICATVFNFEYEDDDLVLHSPEFLTWLWWRMENTDGSLATVNGKAVDLILGEAVKCQSNLGSISAKSVLEEARASLAKGADVVELETFLIDGEQSQKIVFTIFKDVLKGLAINSIDTNDQFQSFAEAFYVVQNYFQVRDNLLSRFEKEQMLITDDLRQNWGLKKFCPMLIGSF